MDIVMLGHSFAGKTTYISVMYSVMNTGLHGFSVRAADVRHHKKLVRAANDVFHGRYPRPSDRRDVFDLVLCYQGADVFPFTWRDYRGGALREHSDNAQANQLHTDLRTAGGIVLFCDSYQLATDPRSRRDVRVLVTHVQRALDARDGQATPLVIALTKADLVDLDDDATVERLREPFEPLIEAIAATTHVFGTVIPIVCGAQPVNVTIPVLWTLHHAIVGEALRLQNLIEEKVTQARNAAARDTWWDRFTSPLLGESSWREISENHMRVAREQYALFEPLVDPANELGVLLDDVPVF